MFVSDVMAMGREKSALDPLSFDGSLELHDAAVEGLLLGGGEVSVFAAAAAVVPSSSQGKGGYKLHEEFFDFVVLVGGG